MATSTNMFSRSMGSAVGRRGVRRDRQQPRGRRRGGRQPLDLEHLSAGVLAPAIHAVFVCSAVVALALLLSGLLMPRQAGSEAPADA